MSIYDLQTGERFFTKPLWCHSHHWVTTRTFQEHTHTSTSSGDIQISTWSRARVSWAASVEDNSLLKKVEQCCHILRLRISQPRLTRELPQITDNAGYVSNCSLNNIRAAVNWTNQQSWPRSNMKKPQNRRPKRKSPSTLLKGLNLGYAKKGWTKTWLNGRRRQVPVHCKPQVLVIILYFKLYFILVAKPSRARHKATKYVITLA